MAKDAGIRASARWARRLVEALVLVTHKQWLVRNARVHFLVEGLTEVGHELLFAKVREMMETDPADLLPRHRHLLNVNFAELGEGRAVDRQNWSAAMDSALKAAQQVEAGKVSQQSLEIFNRPHPRPCAYTRSGRRTSAATPVAGWSPTAPRRASS